MSAFFQREQVGHKENFDLVVGVTIPISRKTTPPASQPDEYAGWRGKKERKKKKREQQLTSVELAVVEAGSPNLVLPSSIVLSLVEVVVIVEKKEKKRKRRNREGW